MYLWKKNKPPPKELPLCPGPKLNLFQHHDSPIEWIERLGDYQGVPFEGYVFRARIRNREYAIKVFKFFDPNADPDRYNWILKDPSPENIAHSDDPFYCECKAYGRINEYINKKKSPSLKNIVAPCHGFLFLSHRDSRELSTNFGVDLGWGEVDLEYQQNTLWGLRPRAIVKDLAVDTHEYWDGKTLNTMLRGILRLNRHGIYNRDIKENNYVGTQLVDFGRAWTLPNLIHDGLPEWQKEGELFDDIVKFHEMVEYLYEGNFITVDEVLAIRHPMTRRSDVGQWDSMLMLFDKINGNRVDQGGQDE